MFARGCLVYNQLFGKGTATSNWRASTARPYKNVHPAYHYYPIRYYRHIRYIRHIRYGYWVTNMTKRTIVTNMTNITVISH